MDELLTYLLPSLTPGGIVFFVLLLFPEKLETWSAMLWKLLAMLGGVFRSAHKKYVKHDLQGRVNDFVKKLSREVPALANERLRIDWVDVNTERKTFIDQGQVVLRLRRDDPTEHNFVHGAYLFISNALLRKTKRYLSPSQREALDLFVCAKLIAEERASAVGVFLDEYLHPRTEDRRSKVSLYVDDFSIIDRGRLFFPVLMQELTYLGEKIFGRRRDDLVHTEVNGLIDFLKPISTRRIGDENDLEFDGTYCRFGIVLVGRPSKLLNSIEPYVNYIRCQLVAKQAETIYIVARAENRKRIEEICVRFSDRYDCARGLCFTGELQYDDRRERVDQYLVVLRRKGVGLIQPSAG